MTAQPSNKTANSSLSSFQLLMLILVMTLVFLMASRSPTDPDMWWHLRAGEETIQAGKPLVVDTMTFTMGGERWVNHSWLSQVVLYLAYRSLGYTGLSLYVALMATATMFVLYRSLKGGSFLKAAIIILVCAVIAPVWSPRPQQFSLLLFAALNAWLQLYIERKTTRLWPLPVVFILWSNLHGGYSFGFMLLGITLVGMVFDRVFRPVTDETMTWREIGRLADWTAISLIAVLINPNGLSTWAIPFQTVGVAVTEYIQEWESIDFHNLSAMPYLVLLFAVVISIGLSNRRVTAVELAGFTLFGVSSLMAQRLIGLFALVAAVVLGRHADSVFADLYVHVKATRTGEKLSDWLASRNSGNISAGVRKSINLTLVALLALAGCIKLLYVSSEPVVAANIAKYYPVGGVNYLSENGHPGHLLSDYGWGGYLDWHLRDNQVFIDGRADLYSNELFYTWLDLISGKNGWEEKLNEYDIVYILLPPNMELIEEAQKAGWQELHRDDISVLLQTR